MERIMEKKKYKKPLIEQHDVDFVLMDTVSGELDQSGVKDGEGGDDLSREIDDLWE